MPSGKDSLFYFLLWIITIIIISQADFFDFCVGVFRPARWPPRKIHSRRVHDRCKFFICVFYILFSVFLWSLFLKCSTLQWYDTSSIMVWNRCFNWFKSNIEKKHLSHLFDFHNSSSSTSFRYFQCSLQLYFHSHSHSDFIFYKRRSRGRGAS